jgi:hypothetical protein
MTAARQDSCPAILRKLAHPHNPWNKKWFRALAMGHYHAGRLARITAVERRRVLSDGLMAEKRRILEEAGT